MNKFLSSAHNRQTNYITSLNFIQLLNVAYYPFKKEDLSISIKFDGENELLETEYKFRKNCFPIRNLKNSI